jgi:hypothetical protein
MQRTQFEWQRSQAAAESKRQQAQFDWQRARADAEISAQDAQFAWQREKKNTKQYKKNTKKKCVISNAPLTPIVTSGALQRR